MAEKINILNELRELSADSLLATGKDNCFSIPENYFDGLPAAVMSAVFLQSIPVSNPYSVPPAYFENFSLNVLNRISKLSTLASTDKIAVYSVPHNYFDNLAQNILARIKNQPKHSEMEQELEGISPLLNSIPKVNVYTVPENYFQGLNPSSVNKVPVPAKVVSFTNARKWMNYAAAACIAALLLGGSYFYLSGKTPRSIVATTAPATNVEAQISGLSDDEIASYLSTNGNTGIYTNAGADNNQSGNADVQNLLQNISDEEIQQYLDQNEEPVPAEDGI